MAGEISEFKQELLNRAKKLEIQRKAILETIRNFEVNNEHSKVIDWDNLSEKSKSHVRHLIEMKELELLDLEEML